VFTEILDGFVVFEGGDGSGTTTQIALLGERFAERRRNGARNPVFFPTAEPTDGEIGRLIRLALKNSPKLHPGTLAGLFAADRNEHVFAQNGIRERCLRGELVVCDRYVPSSLVYQGLACGGELPRRLNSGFPAPRLVLFFDLDPEAAQDRMRGRASLDIFEHVEFQKKARERYMRLLDEYARAGVSVKTIDASPAREKVALEVWSAVSQMPIMCEETHEDS